MATSARLEEQPFRFRPSPVLWLWLLHLLERRRSPNRPCWDATEFAYKTPVLLLGAPGKELTSSGLGGFSERGKSVLVRPQATLPE